MLRSPLRWVGGKCRVRDKIIALFPPHSCYVEVFSGAAWVLFGKPPEISKSEVLNDLDGELINFWRVVKHRSAEFAEAASRVLASRQLFEQARQFDGGGDEVNRAARFYSVIRISFGAVRFRGHFGSELRHRPRIFWPKLREEIGAITGRLQQVWIEVLPWDRCVAKYDSPDTLLYCDPPYRADGSKAYAHSFSDDDHRALAATLLYRVRGKWIVSCNDDSFIRGLYRRHGITLGRLGVRYGLQGGAGAPKTELLIRNF